MPEALAPMTKGTPTFAFFWLHVSTAWPVGVIGLALGNGLVRAGMSVGETTAIIAASVLPFSLELVWAPMVDACATKRRWYIAGVTMMGICLVALLIAPWKAAFVPLLTTLAFSSSVGAAIAAVAVKGLMAYTVPPARLGAASGYYTSGGVFAKAVAGAGTLWLLTHLSSRPFVAGLSVGAAMLAATAIVLTAPERPVWPTGLPAHMWSAVVEVWKFVRTRTGGLIAILCVVPFGAGTEAGLIGAIAREWSISPDQLAMLGSVSVVGGLTGAATAGWLSTRIGPWNVYIAFGCAMIAAVLGLAIAPRTPACFFAVELTYRALASGCYAALLGIILTAIGKGAASTKAAALWGLANFATAYPTLIDGKVHDRAGTSTMLVTDAGLQLTGLVVLLAAARLFRVRVQVPLTPAGAATAE